MRILQLISSFPPAYSYGGALQVAYNLSKNLVENGHHVTIYTTDVFDKKNRFGGINNPEYIDGIEIYRFRNISNKLAADYHISFAPGIIEALYDNIKKFDIIHCHEFRSFEAVIMHHFAKKYQIPYILQTHGAVLPIIEKQRLKSLFDTAWGNRILKDASKIIAVSKTEKQQYLQMDLTENKIEVIPNGIDISEFEKLPEIGLFRKKYGITSDEKIILFLGRLHKSKGLDFLINGFSGLSNRYEKIRLVIAGPDDGFLDILTQQVKELRLGDKVFFLGFLNKDEKKQAFIDADILIYPGIIEIFGLVPFEAIMCGTPVIVTDESGCGEVIKNAECGYPVKYGDVEKLKENVRFILTNKNQAICKVLKGQKYIKERMNYNNLFFDFQEVYINSIRNPDCEKPRNG